MAIEATLDIFSGRENPHWILSSDQQRDLFDLLRTIETPTLQKPSGVLGRLGYRGFILRGSGESPHAGLRLLVHEGIVDFGQSRESRIADSRDLESWLLQTAPVDIPSVVRIRVADHLGQPKFNAVSFLSAASAASITGCYGCRAQDAPAYNPAPWNIPTVQPYNNCYNYANDQITNTFAQPGRAHGVFPANYDCNDYEKASIVDGLVVSPNSQTR